MQAGLIRQRPIGTCLNTWIAAAGGRGQARRGQIMHQENEYVGLSHEISFGAEAERGIVRSAALGND